MTPPFRRGFILTKLIKLIKLIKLTKLNKLNKLNKKYHLKTKKYIDNNPERTAIVGFRPLTYNLLPIVDFS